METEWRHLARDRHQWGSITKSEIHKRLGSSSLSELLSASQEVDCEANERQTDWGIIKPLKVKVPPLWSSGHSSWLQIRRPGFDSRHYQKKKIVGLERGPFSLVSKTKELLDRKVAAPV
jgi:hypothetical protein